MHNQPFDFDIPKNKQELFVVLSRERDALERVLNSLTEEQMLTLGADGWTVKDHLAHIVAWEFGMVGLLMGKPRSQAMGLMRDEYLSTDTEGKNALIYERNKNRSLAEVRAGFRFSYQRLLDVLNRLSDDDLFRTYSYYQSDEPGKDNGRPILDWIAGNTYGHYAEHTAWIQQMRKPK